MAKILIFFINLYQKTLSPDHGWFKAKHPHGYCKYYPSCSEYSKQSLQKYGFFLGLGRSFKRILKCNPWSQGGVDLA